MQEQESKASKSTDTSKPKPNRSKQLKKNRKKTKCRSMHFSRLNMSIPLQKKICIFRTKSRMEIPKSKYPTKVKMIPKKRDLKKKQQTEKILKYLSEFHAHCNAKNGKCLLVCLVVIFVIFARTVNYTISSI